MKKRTRYLILLAGFLFFLAAAPAILFYVQGIKFDVNEKRTERTGLFAVRSEPSKAKVLLNNREVDTTPANLHFIEAGEYEVSLQKDGYHTWSKRLRVKTGLVTWVNPNPTPAYLFLVDTKPQQINQNITDLALNNETLFTLSPTSLTLTNTEDINKSFNITIPKPVTNILISENGLWAYIYGPSHRYIYNKDQQKLTDISAATENWKQISITNEGDLYGIKQATLLRTNTNNKSITIHTNTASYSLSTDLLYVLENTPNGSTLFTRALPRPEENQNQIITTTLPKTTSPQIISTKQKLLFLVDNKTLYRINTTAEEVAQNILAWHYDPQDGSLIYSSPSELSYYSFGESKPRLITRTSATFNDFALKPSLSYSFFTQGNSLTALELDDRGGQNHFTLATGTNPSAFLLDAESKNVYMLDNGTVTRFTIRK